MATDIYRSDSKKTPLLSNPFPLIVVFALLAGVLFLYSIFREDIAGLSPVLPGGKTNVEVDTKMTPFASEADFKSYLAQAQSVSGYSLFASTRTFAVAEDLALDSLEAPSISLNAPAGTSESANSPERVSTTNVQIVGIDEPDIVKTDGTHIFTSSTYFGDNIFIEPRLGAPEIGISRPFIERSETKVVDAFPPENLTEIADIDLSGDLLYHDNTLVVFSGLDINGYDVANAATPKEKWEIELESGQRIVTSRLLGNEIYLVTSRYLESSDPCPVPLADGVTVACTDIYHPGRVIQTDTTYTISKIDIATGEIADTVSFVGSTSSSQVFMSQDALYLSYYYRESETKLMFDFLLTDAADIFPNDFIQGVAELKDYDISDEAKFLELTSRMEKYVRTLSQEDEKRIQKEVQEKAEGYAKRRAREIERTGIVKVATKDLEVEATGGVPGQVLNQFSMDEYKEDFRIATTTGASWFLGDNTSSFSDVYVLDKNLKERGKIEDLGLTERIYSARFIGDRGYLVTFRQIDPFYVLDLSDPDNPKMTGELKIPGFSSYLHPLSDSIILGVGQDGSSVKATLFDVTNPNAPAEKSTLLLSKSWSEIQNSHHAFLADDKHKVFFVPTTQGGFIVSYAGDTLATVTTLEDVLPKRALFINDYLYVVGSDKIVVLDETTWSRVNELSF